MIRRYSVARTIRKRSNGKATIKGDGTDIVEFNRWQKERNAKRREKIKNGTVTEADRQAAFQRLLGAGIIDEQGNLTEPYRD